MNKYRKGEVLASDTCEISQMLLTDVEWQYRYNPFGEPLKKNNYQPQWNERLDYIDKEKDRESKLGDHGVRKYDYELGRFTSVDPLFEVYLGWSPYQYSGNNPL
ncbi:MAG TPA: RHS repeat-associated core domain-containing protein, partial [Candidatus Kapabacteria bacterium]|nr:RHS repeat-associated core domain-containing protein [Candidatus Kapabacteria bacterium]